MKIAKIHIAIAAGAACLVLLGFLFYLSWLNSQPPVLAKSPEIDPLTKVPLSIDLNPMRDRTSERTASDFLRAMRDGNCKTELVDWEKDYRAKRAKFICESEAKNPLLAWKIVDWEDRPPLRILSYKGKRRNGSQEYQDMLSVTMDNRTGKWVISEYDSIY
ncbi:MAG TPA: hypothetical protein VL349_02830 [Terriglobales bacterium]|nr:hypothetical protein [Terriglobales bacterium]